MSLTSTSLNYPRTGKRGVPQQFPRRLYEMLESETKMAEAQPGDTFVISWSDSGKAFRITDVEEFATRVLPRYFRTSKFSSFQRNLNLYGFTKVRRGPDADMYAHNSFIRKEPSLLSQLRKSTSASRRRSRTVSDDSDSTGSHGSASPFIRSVSPSSPQYGPTHFQPIAQKHSSPQCVTHQWMTFQPHRSMITPIPKPQSFQPKMERVGRLDLLALAIEQESCLSV